MTDLIYDFDEVKNFIERILMRLEDDEVYILLLGVRKKWCPGLSRSEEVMDRDMIKNNDPDKILRKIRKISCIDGIYVDRYTLKEVPIDCFTIYCVLDPRSTLKGYSEFISDINKWIYDSFKGDTNLELYRKMDVKLFSAIHKNRSRSLYWVVDIDVKDEELLDKIIGLLTGHIIWLSETHGGFHVIVDRNNETGKIIYENIRGMENVEILKDAITPVPGTLQGGFRVVGIRKDMWSR